MADLIPQKQTRTVIPSTHEHTSSRLTPHQATTPAQAALCRALPCYKLRDGAVRAYLYEEIIRLNLCLNVPRMTPQQVTEAVNLIMGDAGYMEFKPEDFKVCFDMVKKGCYGKSFNRIDSQVIFEWLAEYSKDREDSLIAHNRDKKIAFMTFPLTTKSEATPLPPAFSEETKTKIAAIGKPKDKPPMKREHTVFDGYHDEFDILVKKQDARRVPGPVFIEYEGLLLDRNEYINKRCEQDQPQGD